MSYENDLFEPFPDVRDPVTGDWLPLSESDKARSIRASQRQQMSNSQIANMLSSIFK